MHRRKRERCLHLNNKKITGMDGSKIDYHLSYQFTLQEYALFTPEQKDTLKSDVNNNDTTSAIRELFTELSSVVHVGSLWHMEAASIWVSSFYIIW